MFSTPTVLSNTGSQGVQYLVIHWKKITCSPVTSRDHPKHHQTPHQGCPYQYYAFWPLLMPVWHSQGALNGPFCPHKGLTGRNALESSKVLWKCPLWYHMAQKLPKSTLPGTKYNIKHILLSQNQYSLRKFLSETSFFEVSFLWWCWWWWWRLSLNMAQSVQQLTAGWQQQVAAAGKFGSKRDVLHDPYSDTLWYHNLT